jgi:hypothetical protein
VEVVDEVLPVGWERTRGCAAKRPRMRVPSRRLLVPETASARDGAGK